MKSEARPRPRSFVRRRKPSVAARLRPFWVLGVIAAALLVWGGTWLVRSPWFRVTQVMVDLPLAAPVSRAQVLRAAAIAPVANIWLLNAGAIGRRIEAIPYVDRATVHRVQFPEPAVELNVTVRRPTGCVAAGGSVVTIDATSRVLQTGCAFRNLPHIDAVKGRLAAPGTAIDDQDVQRLLTDARTLAEGNVLVRSVRRDAWGGLEAVGADGVVLRFGDDADLAKKAALVQPVRLGIGTRRVVRAIDLRAPGTPIVEYR